MSKVTCKIISEEIECLWDVIAYSACKGSKKIDVKATLDRITELEAAYKVQHAIEEKEHAARYKRDGIYGVLIACVVFFFPVYLCSYSILLSSIVPILIILSNLDVFKSE